MRPEISRFALCVLAALVQGWVILKFYAVGVWLLYVGVVGAIPFLLLNGVHGDAEGLAGVVGGMLYVLTNGAVYYAIATLVLRLRRRHIQGRTPRPSHKRP
jgi:hypothetical protein